MRHQARACVSVVEPDKSPYWMYSLSSSMEMIPLLKGDYACRQDIPPVYALNGAVYVAESEWLQKTQAFVTQETIGYIMPKERSIDIDTETDLALSNFVLSGGLK